MKKNSKPKLLVIPLLLLCILTSEQVRTRFNNKVLLDAKGVFLKSYKTKIDFEVEAKNILDLLQAEKKRNDTVKTSQPFQFAVSIPVDLDIAKLIEWNYNNDSVYGKFSIKINGALSSSINFDRFHLPIGTQMYIYNENGQMITGPITEAENNKNNSWGSWIYKGMYLTIEVKTSKQMLSKLVLHAKGIGYGYKEIYSSQVGNFGLSAACEINVLCPLGNGWNNERNSVALIINGDNTGFFSGVLINNTCNLNIPYLLTANHCLQASPDVGNWKFTFQAWSHTCNPSQNADGITYNGSTLIANWAGSDFCLIELNQIPPASSGINYAGWSRNTNGITQTTIIHHPMGDVMKITQDNDAPAQANFGNAQCWHLIVDNGITEGGSSGSPYFDQNHRIIGQHYGIDDGNLAICNQVSKYGGRFDLSWDGGGTNATRLSNWLDPSNSGAMVTNTTNISNLSADPSTLSISGDNSFCTTSNPYTIPNLPTGATVTWSSSLSDAVTINSPNLAQTTLTKILDREIILTATISNVCGSNNILLRKTIDAGVPDVTQLSIAGVTDNQTVCPNIPITMAISSPLGKNYKCSLLSAAWSTYPSNATINYNSGNGICPGDNNAGVTIVFPTNNTTYYVEAKAENACGWSNWFPSPMLRVQVSSSGNCGGGGKNLALSASPNPATSTINVSITEIDSTNNTAANSLLSTSQSTASSETTNTTQALVSNSAGITNMYLYDFYTNQLVKKWKYQENTSTTYNLNVSNVKRGIYVLKMERDNVSATTKVILQ